MHDRHLGREARQEAGLLHRGVAAADDHDVLVGEEGGVAGRAVRDAAALEPPLRVQPELAGGGAGRHDHGLGAVLVVADPDAVGALRKVDLGHVVGDELGPEPLGLPPELGHHLRPEDAVGVPGVILNIARDHQLATPVEALDHERLQVRAGSVKGGGVPGRAASDDDHLANLVVSHCPPVVPSFSLLNDFGRLKLPELGPPDPGADA